MILAERLRMRRHDYDPELSGALIVKSANQTVTTNTATEAVFATEIFDTGGYHSGADPNAFIAPVDGYYQLYAGCRWATVTSETMREMKFLKNGSTFAGGGGQAFLAPAAAVGSLQNASTPFVAATAGDRFTVQVRHLRGSDLDLNVDDRTYFGIRYMPTLDGVMLKLNSTKSLAANTLDYIEWDEEVYNTWGGSAWDISDPERIYVPSTLGRRFRTYTGLRFPALTGSIFLNLDRNTGSRPGFPLEEVRTTATGSYNGILNCASALFYPNYDGTQYGGLYSGLDTLPNYYRVQVRQFSGGSATLPGDEQTYFAVNQEPLGSRETLIRLASNQTITTGNPQQRINWGNSVAHDDYGMYDPVNFPYGFTIPAGYRHARLSASVTWDDDSTAFDRWIEFQESGVRVPGSASMTCRASAGEFTRTHINTIIPVTAGQQYEVWAWQNSGGDSQIITGNTPHFAIQLFR